MTSPINKRGKVLLDKIISSVTSFYEDDANSRLMPGMKDLLSIKNDDDKRVERWWETIITL